MGNATNHLVGHFIDIDPQGTLRLRFHHQMIWDSAGRITELTPLSQSHTKSRHPFIVPGAIDCHVHFPQTRIIGGYGKDLLDWLDLNVWPEEKRFADERYASEVATEFLQQLVRHGTTSALVFGSQFHPAMEHLFAQAKALGMCLISGLTLQDRNTDPVLELAVEQARANCEALIERWHLVDRLRYAVTSRFSPACSPEMLTLCRELFHSREDLYFQTHINESASEIEFVRELFPDCQDYLETYEKFNLIQQRSVLAHSVHPTESELKRMGLADCSVAHCPSSNGFLGSGAFPYQRHLAHQIRVGIGTDVGAGVSFSMWNEMRHAHLMQMRHPFEQRHLMTGERMLKAVTYDSAHALHLLDEIGNFEPGKWADFVVLSDSQSPSKRLFSEEMNHEQCSRAIFQLATQQPAGHISQTWIAGKQVFADANK